MSNASLCFILDEGLETFLGIRDLEIYILLIYMVTRLQNYRTYRLLALFETGSFVGKISQKVIEDVKLSFESPEE